MRISVYAHARLLQPERQVYQLLASESSGGALGRWMQRPAEATCVLNGLAKLRLFVCCVQLAAALELGSKSKQVSVSDATAPASTTTNTTTTTTSTTSTTITTTTATASLFA